MKRHIMDCGNLMKSAETNIKKEFLVSSLIVGSYITLASNERRENAI